MILFGNVLSILKIGQGMDNDYNSVRQMICGIKQKMQKNRIIHGFSVLLVDYQTGKKKTAKGSVALNCSHQVDN